MTIMTLQEKMENMKTDRSIFLKILLLGCKLKLNFLTLLPASKAIENPVFYRFSRLLDKNLRHKV
ncbi:MAG: hypothetical protein M3033_19295 [Acidobacteriota bacterium]|nr:hypothetical protein [Acidobacteriota bacterium]